MNISKLFERKVTKERIRSDFAFLEDEYHFEVEYVEEPGINDLLAIKYKSKGIGDIIISRDRGYYEISIKKNSDYENMAYEKVDNEIRYNEYYGKEGYERLVRDARIFVKREIDNLK